MASLEEIASRFPKAIEELQRSNERAAEDARVSQNRELEDLRKSVRESTDKRTREHKDNVQKLARMNENIREAAKKEEELSKTSAGQAMALKKELESQGKIAEDNKEFQKLSYQARKADFKQRLADATSPAAKKEIREEARKDAKANGSRLDKIAAGVGGLFEIGKKGLKTAALGGLAILSTLAIGAFMIALGKFLQSDTFKKITKFIQETILPKLQEFWEFLKDNWKGIGILLAGVLTAFVVFKGIVVAAKIIGIIKKIGFAFMGIKAFFASTLLPVITSLMVPLFPIIVAVAAIGLVIYSLMEAFEDAEKKFEETGSLGEALKAGISKFMGSLLGFIPSVVLKLVSWVAGLFGFDDFKNRVDAIDPIEFISKHISAMITKITDFVKKLFKDPVAAIKSLVKGYIDVITDFAGFVYREAIKPVVDWIGREIFGVEDASGQMEGFVGKQLDKIINFAEEIYNKYIKPVVDWVKKTFSFDVSGTASSIMDMLPDLSNMMPDLPTWDNIKGKIGTLLNDLLQGMAEMMDIRFLGGVSRGISDLGTEVASSLGAEVSNKYNPKTETTEVVDSKTGVKLNAQQLQEFEASKVEREASELNAGGAAPVVVTDASSTTTNNTTTGPSGQTRIKNERYGGLHGQAYEFEGF